MWTEEFDLRLVSDVRKQSHISGALDGDSKHSLILGGSAGDSLRSDLSARRDVLLQEFDILVIDILDMVFGEIANLFARLHSTIHIFFILSA